MSENTESTFVLGPIQKVWIKSLREHPERQGKRVLGLKSTDGLTYQACCLGEGGLIAGVCEWRGNILCVTTTGADCYLRDDAYKALGLDNYSGKPIDLDFGLEAKSLAFMNDEGISWQEIADLLEKHPEKYFRESK